MEPSRSFRRRALLVVGAAVALLLTVVIVRGTRDRAVASPDVPLPAPASAHAPAAPSPAAPAPAPIAAVEAAPNGVPAGASDAAPVPPSSVASDDAASPPAGMAPEFADFAAWQRAWQAGDAAARDAAGVARGLALAERRSAVMRALIEADPAAALVAAMPATEREALPPAIAARVERQLRGRGDYTVLAVCGHGEAPAADGHRCHFQREVVLAGERFTAHVFGRRIKRVTRSDAALAGVALDGAMAVEEGDADGVPPAAATDPLPPTDGPALAAGPTLNPSAPPAGPTPPTTAYNEYTGTFAHQFGPKTIMVFLVEPSDGAAWTAPPTFATLDSQTTSASQWWFNQSYGLTWFGAKYRFPGTASEVLIPRLVVTPVLKLPKTKADYLASFYQLQTDCKAAAEAQGGTWTNNGVNDPDHYDRWVVMSNTKMISSTGLAYVGGKFAWTGGGISGGVANHEHGHNWGVFHANSWTVAAGTPSRSASGSHGEYGDGRDVMGGNSSIGFNPLFLETLGFLRASEGEILTITGSGTYRLYDRADPYSKNATSKVRALMVPVTGTTTSSKRIMLGFAHEGGTDGGSGRTDWERNAVGVHSDNTSAAVGDNDGSHRLDTSPGSRQSGDEADSAIPIGQTWSEAADVNGTCAGFHITPIARGSVVGPSGQTHQWIDVKVVLGWPANAAPTGSIAVSPASPATGAAATLTATASDADGDTLSYRWLYGDGTWSITNSATQTKTWATAGLYRVDCHISDGRGGTTTRSTWVDVGGGGLKPAVNPGATLAGLEYRYHEGVWTRLPDPARQRPLAGGTVAAPDLTPRLRNDGFGFVYSGYLSVAASDVYTFTLTGDDGARLRIAGQQVVLKDGVTGSATFASGNIGLAAGLHAFELEYFHRDGSESLSVQWETLTMAKAAIPSSAFRRPDRSGDAAPVVALQVASTAIALGGSASFTATASDADDAISKVQYFWNRALIGEATTAPYALTWSGLWPGDKSVVAVAWTADGRYAVSSATTLGVAPPPVARAIGINLRGGSSTDGSLAVDQVAGAIHRHANWNTVIDSNATISALKDRAGVATAAAVTVDFTHNNGFVNANAEATEPDGRLLDGGLWTRDSGVTARLTVTGVPWATSDVYVYFDAALDQGADASLGGYTLNGATRYGRNSLGNADQLGDWPTYDTWVGFREATATATSAPQAAQLGNYLVFRNVAATTLTLDVQTARPLSAVQIVEAGGGGANQAPLASAATANPATLVLP